ncbi:hypothetical protein BC332_33577 [Capsicum chinense]|nr:hypothetical protein BC332_33577 [Capsicum chinense]
MEVSSNRHKSCEPHGVQRIAHVGESCSTLAIGIEPQCGFEMIQYVEKPESKAPSSTPPPNLMNFGPPATKPKKRGRPKKPPLAQTPSVVCHARVSYNDTPIEVVATNKRSEEETRVDVVSRINEGPSFELLSQNMLIVSDEVDVKSNKKWTSQFKFLRKKPKYQDKKILLRSRWVGDVLQNGNFFQELENSTSDLSDEHIDACLYYFRKKYCYHGEHLCQKIKCTTIDTIFNGTVEIVKLFKKHGWFVGNSSEEQMTNYARGLQISALTYWSYVDKILLPMHLSPTKKESESTHYVLGVLDLSKKVIDLYDSISDKKYGRRSMALAKTNGRLLPDLLKALCLKDEHPSYGDDVKTFSVVRKEDVPKQPGLNVVYIFSLFNCLLCKGWAQQPSLKEFDNLLSSQELLAKQLSSEFVKERKENALVADKRNVKGKIREMPHFQFSGSSSSPRKKKNLLIIISEETATDPLLEDKGYYQRTICRLLYLTMTMPDIAYVIQNLSQHMLTPRQSHLDAAIRVMKYIKGTVGLGLFMPAGHHRTLIVYCDFDCGACVETRKSSTESKFRSMAATVAEITWLIGLFKELGVEVSLPIAMQQFNL